MMTSDLSKSKNWMADIGAKIVDNGWPIIPIMPGSKAPGRWSFGEWAPYADWTRHCARATTATEVDVWSQWPGCSIGMPCGQIVGIDIDLEDDSLAYQVEQCAQQVLGHTPLVRIGNAPKRMLVYRASGEIKSFQRANIQILANGRQFVAFAIHPKTRRPYLWLGDSPAEVDISDVPAITESQCREFLDRAVALLPEQLRQTQIPHDAKIEGNKNKRGTVSAIADALKWIPNDDWHYDAWISIGLAIKGAIGEAGRELWMQWSAVAPKNNPKETARKWDRDMRTPRAGAGTIYFMARRYGWVPDHNMVLDGEYEEALNKVDLSRFLTKVNAIYEQTQAEYRSKADFHQQYKESAASSCGESTTNDDKQSEPNDLDPDELIESERPISGNERKDALIRELYREMSRYRGTSNKVTCRSFPRHLLNPGGVAGELVGFLVKSSRNPQPELSLGAALTFLGALMGRRVMGPTKLRTNLFIIGVADSGAGKGHQRQMIKEILNRLGQSNLIGGDKISSGAGLISRLTRENNTLYVLDEFGMFLKSAYDPRAGSYIKEIVSNFTSFYSETNQTWMGADYADTHLKPVKPIVQPHLSIFGITNPVSLWDAFSSGSAMDGSLARYLVFYPSIMFPDKNRGADPTVPQSIIDSLSKIVTDIPVVGGGNLSNSGVAMTGNQPYQVPITDDAKVAIEVFEDRLLAEQRKHQGTSRTAILSRVVENSLKVACILAVADHPADPCINKANIDYAIELCNFSATWLAAQSERLIADGDFGKKLVKVREIIIAAGANGLSSRQLTYETKGFLAGARERAAIVADLADARAVICCRKHSGGKGRPTEMVFCLSSAPKDAILQAAIEEAEFILSGATKKPF